MTGSSSRSLFFEHLGRVRDATDTALQRFVDERLVRAKAAGATAERIVVAARALALRGGKRFRAALLSAAYVGCGGKGGSETVVLAGVALELLQTYLLIHDDWMDEDVVRRGGPTVHAELGKVFASASLGATSAVLAGDHAAAMAQAALLEVPLPAPQLVAAAREFARIQEDVALGQMLDVHATAEDATAVERMHDLKTGSYTVRGPLKMGAVLAGATADQLAALDRFAAPLGVAFQLRDDLLGTFGDPETTGKPAGNDVRQGKRTALVAELDGVPEAPHLLREAFGAEASMAAVEAVQRMMTSSGARARVEARLATLLQEARDALVAAPLDPGGRALLEGAVDALGERER